MKRHFIFSVLSAVTLMGLTAVTSCSSSSDEVENVNPGYDPATGEVPVNLVLNVGMNTAANTRQGVDATQAATSVAAAKFRGIIGAHIMCFKQADNGRFLATAATAAKDFDMAQMAAPTTLSSTLSRRVLEMSLPLKTNTIVFYGKADGSTDKNEHGHLDDTDGYGVNKDLTQTSFHLGKRLTVAQKTDFTQTQSLLAAVMTCIMNVHRGTGSVYATDAPADEIPAYGFDIPAKAEGEEGYLYDVKWSDYVPSDGKKSPVDNTIDLTSLEEKLGKVYKEMTTIQTAELRNGSGTALKSTVKNLWSIVNSVRCATPTNLSEAVAKHLAQVIHDEISKYFEASVPTNGGSVTSVNFRAVSTITTALSADSYWPAGAGDKPSVSTAVSSKAGTYLAAFPENLDLPQGSTHVKFDNEKKSFYYVENYNTSAVGGSAFTVDDYYYPAELLYFGNSPIRVTDDEHVVADYPQGTTAWDTEENTSWNGWTADGEVKSSTRSVAMRNDINYGTALLQTTVGYTTDVANGTKKLQDNNHVVQLRDYGVSEANNQITPTETSFKLVGIVIGGQSPRVGWNFLPKLANGEKQGYIFDKAIANNGAIPLSGSDKNYTLVFDNYNATAAQDKVYIALELQNNTGADFMGKDNLIPNGSNFYLIGELDPAKDGLATPTWPTYHALPPYTDGRTMNPVSRIFIQDYKTVANFKIGEYSLQYAYLTVPDLRSGSVTLGLSVDLSWTTGLTFDGVLLGGGE
jgi:hypothetical protein